MNKDNKFQDDQPIHNPYTGIKSPPNLEKLILADLKKKGLIRPGRPFLTSWFWRSAAAAAVIAGLLILLNLFRQPEQTETSSPTAGTYLLLLHNPVGSVENKDRVQEYASWFEKYHLAGYLQSGEELRPRSIILTGHSPLGHKPTVTNLTSDTAFISGYFIISAPSEEMAAEIASSCPHLRYNGTLELRQILN